MAVISSPDSYYSDRSHGGNLSALNTVGDVLIEEEQESQSSPFPQLDALWHYDCVVSSRSPTPNRMKSSPPRSPVHRAANPAASSPASLYDHQPLRMAAQPSPLSSNSHPSLAANTVANHHRSSRPGSHFPAAASSGSPAPSPLSRFAPAQKALAKLVFSTFDENGDGRVSMEEIGRIFQKLGLSSSEDVDSLTVSLLADIPSSATQRKGQVNEEEFSLLQEMASSIVQAQADGGTSTAAADDQSAPWPGSDCADGEEQNLRAAFQVFDKDGNGYISAAELQSVLCSLGFEEGQELEACEDMIARVDENGDGHVDFFEFKKLFHLDNPFIPAIQTF